MTARADRPEPASTPVRTDESLGFDLPAPASISPVALSLFVAGALAMISAVFIIAYIPRHRERAALEEGARAAGRSLARVELVAPKLVASDRALLIPGSVQPLKETVLYARASGFVQRWLLDMGDVATAGQLLAEIETPELDQELAQARAQLAQAQPLIARAKANLALSTANLNRYAQLAPKGLAAQADLDQRRAQAETDSADVHVAEAGIVNQVANIRRLSQLKAFSKVTAPFAGRITQRWVEVGALVTAGNGQPLYKIAAIDPARVFVQVPQDVAPGVRPGLRASVIVREFPGRPFEGTIERSAGELDAVTRTMTTEVRVPNADGTLLPGMYAEVSLTLPAPHRAFELPATALITDARGLHVAVVDGDGRVHLAAVVVERDTGSSVEISTGLTGAERVIKFASADLVDGQSVETTR